VTANVPKEILLDVLGFLSRTKLDDCMFINKKWNKLIKGAGVKLPQRQLIEMKFNEPLNGPLSLKLFNYKKTIRVTEGQDNPPNVLEHCIVRHQSINSRFEERYQRIIALMGQKVPILLLDYDGNGLGFEGLRRFRDKYSSLFLYKNLKLFHIF